MDAVREGLSRIIRDINELLSDEKPEKKARGEISEELVKINAELGVIESDLAELRDEEKKFEQGQEHFYEAFKLAVSDVEKAKHDLEKWEAEHQVKRFERERLTLRR